MIATEPLINWPDPPRELIGFLASYLTLGAVGYYYGVLVHVRRAGGPAAAALADSGPRAARIGLIGVFFGALSLLVAAIMRAHLMGLSFTDALLVQRGPILARLALIGLLVIGFSLASARMWFGWCLATFVALWIQLNGLPAVFSGRWFGIVNPVHVLGGSLWLGTLFVMMVAGVGVAANASVPAGDKDAAIGSLVRKFTAIALTGAGLLGITGVTTAWRHLHRWSSLWTTPYGYTLDAKLLVVFFILGLGYYHWRQAGPNLKTADDVKTFKMTAWRELKLAGVVLLITSVLVSLPSPRSRPEGAQGPGKMQGPPPGGPGAPPKPAQDGDHD